MTSKTLSQVGHYPDLASSPPWYGKSVFQHNIGFREKHQGTLETAEEVLLQKPPQNNEFAVLPEQKTKNHARSSQTTVVSVHERVQFEFAEVQRKRRFRKRRRRTRGPVFGQRKRRFRKRCRRTRGPEFGRRTDGRKHGTSERGSNTRFRQTHREQYRRRFLHCGKRRRE